MQGKTVLQHGKVILDGLRHYDIPAKALEFYEIHVEAEDEHGDNAERALAPFVQTIEQQMLVRHNADHPQAPLRVRIGMHTGNIFHSGDDVLGRAVILAARITGRARGGEILVSAACRDYTERQGRWRYGRPVELALKGLASAERVYSLDWAEPA